MRDQAERLREKMRLFQERNQARTILVTSGKGGVGKSNMALNMALCLAQQNKRTLLFDLDLGFANLDLLIGTTPRYTLIDALNTGCSLHEVIEQGPYDLQLIYGGSALEKLVSLNPQQMSCILNELGSLAQELDFIILDTGAGLGTETLRLMQAADDIWLVTTPEPTSITDAYTVIKMLSQHTAQFHVQLIVNRCQSAVEGRETAHRLLTVVRRFLNKEIFYLGHVPHDPAVSQAVLKQRPFIQSFPHSPAAKAVYKLTAVYLNQPLKKKEGIKEAKGLPALVKHWLQPLLNKRKPRR